MGTSTGTRVVCGQPQPYPTPRAGTASRSWLVLPLTLPPRPGITSRDTFQGLLSLAWAVFTQRKVHMIVSTHMEVHMVASTKEKRAYDRGGEGGPHNTIYHTTLR